MDLPYFVTQRTSFVRQLFATATRPYLERMAAIESGSPPYDGDSGDPESGEPAFLAEWLEAKESVRVLGQSCLSLASATLHLTLEHFDLLYLRRRSAQRLGNRWLASFADVLKMQRNIDLSAAPVDFGLLEEVVLARNSTQHMEHITQTSATYRASDLKRNRRPTFVSESDLELVQRLEPGEINLLLPHIDVTVESLNRALSEMDKLATWLYEELQF